MANEQEPRLHDVHPLLRLRRRLVDVRVRGVDLPGVGLPGQRQDGHSKRNPLWCCLAGGGGARLRMDVRTHIPKHTHTHT